MVLDKIPNTQLFTQRDVRETANIGLTPNITNFSNSQHDHADAVGGGNTTHESGDGSDHADVASNTSSRHTQDTDTALGSGAVAADHGTAATDQIINVSYGTGSEPTASTTTEGSIYIKYVA